MRHRAARNSRSMKATSGIPGTMKPRVIASTCVGHLLEPVAQNREVMRAEIPGDADVGLMEAQVDPAHRDEVDLSERAGLDQLAHRDDRRAVEERVAGHQHRPVLLCEPDQLEASRATRRRAASRRRRACRPRALPRERRNATRPASQSRPRRRSSARISAKFSYIRPPGSAGRAFEAPRRRSRRSPTSSAAVELN